MGQGGRWIMQKIITVTTVIALIAALLTPGAFAQMGMTSEGSGRPPEIQPTPHLTPSERLGAKVGKEPAATLQKHRDFYASSLIGAPVKTPEGNKLGELVDMVVDGQDASVTTAVVSVGGVLGIGSKSVAIPWHEMMPSEDGQSLVVAMTKDELENAPAWKKPDEKTRSTMRTPTTLPEPSSQRAR
jgi:sporulation protein YlmC with PRC-barrel domain